MVAQPQALAQQVAHRALDRVLVVAGDRLDLAARDPQAGFQRIGRIQHLADGARARVLADAASGDPAAYKPRTAHDNKPYRFDMTQNGKRMTADDFDAWLKANGYSAGRRVDPAAPQAPAAAPAAAPEAVPATRPGKD